MERRAHARVTETFRDSREAQCGTLAFKPAVVFVPHTIQDCTDAELTKLADTFKPILRSVCETGS